MKAPPSLPAESPLVASGRWEWKVAGETSHESPPLPRRKREIQFLTEGPLGATTLQEDETTQPFMELEEDETTQPGVIGSSSSTEVMATSSSLTETSTEAAAVVHLSTRRYKALLHGRMTTASLSEDFTETEGTKDGGVDTTRPTSTTSSQALVATSARSVAALGPDSKPGVKTVGRTNSSLSPPVARPSSTVPARPPSREGPPEKMVGQCLLAISFLALVAAVFIIATFVLIALLLRQKRAYKLRKHNPTEMVCISSLLAAEEAEASRGRVSRAKRGKMLAENGSETDIDNLTLNSFLPDH